VLKKNNLVALASIDGEVLVGVCTKRHYDIIQKADALNIPAGTKSLPWKEDGKNGKNDPNNSEAILLEWVTSEENYNKYRFWKSRC
jgi:hypothetical protein